MSGNKDKKEKWEILIYLKVELLFLKSYKFLISYKLGFGVLVKRSIWILYGPQNTPRRVTFIRWIPKSQA